MNTSRKKGESKQTQKPLVENRKTGEEERQNNKKSGVFHKSFRYSFPQMAGYGGDDNLTNALLNSVRYPPHQGLAGISPEFHRIRIVGYKFFPPGVPVTSIIRSLRLMFWLRWCYLCYLRC
ncbi:hypothetical protein NPIL_136471 [Nephila pilipes]|uniref:Uncharacterized protein n=1 Tax=Nephila pilipes TaxID=299642 RepID=A0A8X6IGP2_NEPPI|nr:hypothetical protein NPIL_136471 [Nephila pilipes]